MRAANFSNFKVKQLRTKSTEALGFLNLEDTALGEIFCKRMILIYNYNYCVGPVGYISKCMTYSLIKS